MKKEDKKGLSMILEAAIYILAVILFLGILAVFTAKSANNTGFEEKVQVRKIALIIDSIRSGTEIIYSLEELQKIAEKNGYNGPITKFDLEKGEVTISLAGGKGQTYKYFTKIETISGDGRKEVKIKV